MAGIQDFRELPFARSRVADCGRYVGHESYWKLYVIENYLRVILHSILSAQISGKWFETAADPTMKENIAKVKKRHLKKPTHTSPGKHDVYYIYLSDLTKIMTAHSHLIVKVIADVDLWVARLEDVRMPRNLVGHMNFPNIADRRRIQTVYGELTALMQKLETTDGLRIQIP